MRGCSRRVYGTAAIARVTLLAGLLAGCAQHIDVQPTKLQGFAPWSSEIPQHRLAAGDEIELRFLFDSELNERLIVGEDGRVDAPLLGPVLAEGMTVPQFTADLEHRYAADLKVPNLDVIVRNYGSSRIYVGGEVKNPGVAPMVGRLDVLQGVLLAGGPLPTAALGQVVVIRRNADNQPMLRTVDLRRLIGQADPRQDFPLLPSDVLYVTRSGVAEVDLFVEQYINDAIPFSKSINANLFNGYGR